MKKVTVDVSFNVNYKSQKHTLLPYGREFKDFGKRHLNRLAATKDINTGYIRSRFESHAFKKYNLRCKSKKKRWTAENTVARLKLMHSLIDAGSRNRWEEICTSNDSHRKYTEEY